MTLTTGAVRLWRCPWCCAIARTALLAPLCLGTEAKRHSRQIMVVVDPADSWPIDETRRAVLA